MKSDHTPPIISKPNESNVKKLSGNSPQGFGYAQLRGGRKTQEDALIWHSLPKETFQDLTPQQIGERLWTSHHIVNDRAKLNQDEDIQYQGTTASTTIFDGNDTLITATLADAVSFAAVYNLAGELVHVMRLNRDIHRPVFEKARIEAAGGSVSYEGLLCSLLAVSRAIGDTGCPGMCADARIDMISIEQLAKQCSMDRSHIGKIRIFTTCDGFTDPVELKRIQLKKKGLKKNMTVEAEQNQIKMEHEEYLSRLLKEFPHDQTDEALAMSLAERALHDGSQDNISIAVQTLSPPNQAFPTAILMGMYDGHLGPKMSSFVAENMGSVFAEQCKLSREEYLAQSRSVETMKVEYRRDHAHLYSLNSLSSAPVGMITETGAALFSQGQTNPAAQEKTAERKPGQSH